MLKLPTLELLRRMYGRSSEKLDPAQDKEKVSATCQPPFS